MVLLWPKKIYKIDETTHSYFKIRWSHYPNLYWSTDKCWAHTWCDERFENVITSIKLLDSLGFVIHPNRSIFLPKQEITFFGFNINSQKMEITLTDTSKETLKACCGELLHKNNQTIRYVAKVIDLMTSSLPWVKYGAAHYKYLEEDRYNKCI